MTRKAFLASSLGGVAASCGLYSAKRLDGLQLGKLGIAGSVTYEDLANPGMEFVEPCLFWPKVCTGDGSSVADHVSNWADRTHCFPVFSKIRGVEQRPCLRVNRVERFQFTNDLSRLVLLCILKEEAEGFCLATYNTATKELIATVKGPELQDGCSEMSLSPDAQRVALTFARRGVIRIFENGVKVQEWQGRRSQLSPRGDRIAYLNPDNQVVIRVLATRKESIIARALKCSSLYWSPDEQFLLHSTRLRFGIMGVTLLIVDANTGSEIWSKNVSAPTCGGNYFLRSRPVV